MGLMSGLGKTLDSQVNLFSTLMPYTEALMAAQVAPASTVTPTASAPARPAED